MSVTDIFPVGPDYPVDVETLDGVLRQQAHDGQQFERPLRADVRRFLLEFRSRPTAELQQIIAFQRRMRDQVFLFHHKVWERGSWNLLGIDAEAERTGTTTFYLYKSDGFDQLFPLAHLGVAPGDTLIISAELKNDTSDRLEQTVDPLLCPHYSDVANEVIPTVPQVWPGLVVAETIKAGATSHNKDLIQCHSSP